MKIYYRDYVSYVRILNKYASHMFHLWRKGDGSTRCTARMTVVAFDRRSILVLHLVISRRGRIVSATYIVARLKNILRDWSVEHTT